MESSRHSTVINFWGAPGSGKSTAAAELFVQMKKDGANIELTTEYAKDLVYSSRPVALFKKHNIKYHEYRY